MFKFVRISQSAAELYLFSV